MKGMLALILAGGLLLPAFSGETVVFVQPNGASTMPAYRTARPEQTMPFGAGNLNAMVSFSTDTLELHLSRTDYILAAKRNATEFASPDLPSIGHVSVRFPGLTLTGFRQVMDIDRGEVRLTLRSSAGDIEVLCAGDRATGALVVRTKDARPGAKPPEVVFSSGRAAEKEKYPDSALERLLDGWSFREHDIPSGRFYETRAQFADSRLVIASQTGAGAEEAKKKVLADVAAARQASDADLEARRLAWWKAFWSRSHIELTGDPRAERLAKLWRINLYCWGNVAYGELPPKFNGGPGLVFGDSRAWGSGFWWQNTRELIWPMAAANHPEFARQNLLFYDAVLPRLRKGWGAKGSMFEGFDGRYLPETVDLGCHPLADPANRWERPDRTRPYLAADPSVRASALARRRAFEPSFTSHIFSAGAEYVQQLAEYVRYTGDTSMIPVLADWTREQVGFYLGVLEKEKDGRWHVKCTNVCESWWAVDDSLIDLCGIRFVFTLALAHGREWGYPKELLAAARERLAALAPFPTADDYRFAPISPTNDYRMIVRDFRPGTRRWTSTWLREGQLKSIYAPTEAYIVFPFNMSRVAETGPDRDRAIAAYAGLREECDFIGADNYFLGYWGWDHMPVVAVRLRLPTAAEEVCRHMDRTFRWPFGGAKSPAGVMYEGCEVEDCPYFDGSGVMATALQEMLLQSQNEEPDASLLTGGPIRLLPAVPRTWSGSFRLCARGGFVVDCRFLFGRVLSCRVHATRGGTLRYVNPESGCLASVETKPGETVVVK